MSNTPIAPSRECIRDTFLAKRHAKGKPDGLILRVYNHCQPKTSRKLSIYERSGQSIGRSVRETAVRRDLCQGVRGGAQLAVSLR